jgi:hypothetical protein
MEIWLRRADKVPTLKYLRNYNIKRIRYDDRRGGNLLERNRTEAGDIHTSGLDSHFPVSFLSLL